MRSIKGVKSSGLNDGCDKSNLREDVEFSCSPLNLNCLWDLKADPFGRVVTGEGETQKRDLTTLIWDHVG